ncbi:hypothetical protein B0H13DRAFT_2327100 [Mycena leptocephala]|nr:hypothetical protein B0H13DRAFT_2327100 [Mycena leptocephala]
MERQTNRGPSYPTLNPEPLDLPCLARLSVSNSHFLDYLVTPSLQALCGQKSRFSRITSACKLAKFVCYQCEDANALIEVVRASTSIKYLYIEDCGADLDELIIWPSVEEGAARIWRPSPSWKIAKLTSSIYKLEAPPPVEPAVFVDFIRTRCINGKLRSGTLASFNYSFSPECLAAFTLLQGSGLDFRCVGAETSESTVRKVFRGWCPPDLYIPDIFTADA